MKEFFASFIRPMEVCFNLGTRPGESELLALKWEDIDFEQGTARIYVTKTRSYRTVPINASLLEKMKCKKSESQSGYVVEYRGKNIGMSQSVDLRTNGTGSGTIQDWSMALLGAYRRDAWSVDAVARLGLDTFESSRSLVLPGVSRTAKGRWNGLNTSLSVGSSYDFKAGEYTFGPIASLEWQYLSEGGFTETGAGTLGQRIGARQNQSLKTMSPTDGLGKGVFS